MAEYQIRIDHRGRPRLEDHGGVSIARAYRVLGLSPPSDGEPARSSVHPDKQIVTFLEQHDYKVIVKPLSLGPVTQG
jgi:hypothetical protein